MNLRLGSGGIGTSLFVSPRDSDSEDEEVEDVVDAAGDAAPPEPRESPESLSSAESLREGEASLSLLRGEDVTSLV